MKRAHVMPFGAEVQAGSGVPGVRFRLWAPSARRVALLLGDAEVPMSPMPQGWWDVQVAAAGRGDRYRYRIDDRLAVPDPASRFNPNDVHGASEVVAPEDFAWHDGDWRGRPWHEAVIYELQVGTFSWEGSFSGVARRLDYLAELGVTAVELMPLADFPGRRNWGYDGVLPFAPDSRYGRPDDLKRLVERAHSLGMMVLLDVVYNHFGPDGNYLGTYATPFFTDRHPTPWGAAIDFDGPESRTVRDFFVHNALYWLEEYHLDGLRLDAVHAIHDASSPHIVDEIAAAVRRGPGAARHVHLILENDRNQARHLSLATAQWNDDFHHAMHVLLTGENDGYYADYAAAPLVHLARCLAEGFAWQGEPSAWHGGARRGEPSGHLPCVAFVPFLQNHDQVGNRAFGERLCTLAEPPALAAALAVLLLQPAPPLLFMGEEFAAPRPFLFFCDFAGSELGAAVSAGRRAQFAQLPRFADPQSRSDIPDPNAAATHRASVLDWDCLDRDPHARWLARYRALLELRRRRVVPHLSGTERGATVTLLGATALAATWRLGDGSGLTLLANLGPAAAESAAPRGEALYLSDGLALGELHAGHLPAWSAACFLDAERGQ